MDLPTCPSCKQSVLDDDAEVCPFCGASMSGKPGARPAVAGGAAKGTAAAPRPAAKTGGGTKPSAAASVDDDADPFDMQAPAASMIQASPKRTAARRHEVVCPMCETKGYVPESAAGKDVKCHNPQCMVPVFTAPELAKPEPVVEAPPPPKKSNRNMVMGGLIAGILVIAGGIYWYLIQPSPIPPTEDPFADLVKNTSQSNGNPPAATDTLPKSNGTTGELPENTVQTPPQPVPAAGNLEKDILPKLIEAAQNADKNRSKPFSRRLAAVAFAEAGQPVEAVDQVQRLLSLQPTVTWYQIEPQVVMAWTALAAGQADAAKTNLDAALAAAGDLPKFGRDPLDTALGLASVLAAAGRDDDALGLLKNHVNADAAGQLSAALGIVRATGSFNLDVALPGEVVGGWEHPQWAASTAIIAAHGQPDRALEWARKAPGSTAQTAALIAWAELLARQGLERQQPADVQRARDLAAELNPAARARLLARLAIVTADAGQPAEAEARLAEAVAALAQVPLPTPLKFADIGELFKLELPDPVPLRQSALSAAEVAGAQARLKQLEPAWRSMQLALEFARGMAPSQESAVELARQIKSRGPAVIRSELTRLFDLKNDDQARRKGNDLTRLLADITKAAESRFALQVDLLGAAIEWGLGELAWQDMTTRSDASEPSFRETYLATRLPRRLAAFHAAKGSAEAGQQVLARLQGQNPVADPLHQLQSGSSQAVADKQAKAIATAVNQAGKVPEADRWALLLACRICNSGDDDLAFQYVLALENPVLREEALRLIAARAAVQGRAQVAWQICQSRDLPQTDRIAWGCGIVDGLAAASRK